MIDLHFKVEQNLMPDDTVNIRIWVKDYYKDPYAFSIIRPVIDLTSTLLDQIFDDAKRRFKTYFEGNNRNDKSSNNKTIK